MKKIFLLGFLVSFSIGLMAQEKEGLINKLKDNTEKGDYIVLELRLNKEDEFRTMEGGKSSLARIAVYTGENRGEELIEKGFDGMNSVLSVMNNLKRNDFKLIEVYTIKGESLIVTHYVLERRK